MKTNTVLIAAVVLTLAQVQAFGSDLGESVGETATSDSAVRHVTVNADTRWLEVKEGETVQFDVNNRSFVWRFNGARSKSEIDLNKIAPAGLLKNKVEVYIDHLPSDYRG